MATDITAFVPAPKALPVCGYAPPGGCVTVQPDCTYPPGTNFCVAPGNPYAVPVDGGVMLAVVVLLLVVVAGIALGRK